MTQDRKRQPLNIGVDGISRSKADDAKIDALMSEVFSTPAGREVLKYLRSVTIEMVSGPSVEANSLFHAEGQRYIVGMIELRTARGVRSKANV